ncbi:MAG: amino acid ABC transporter substrate-binding protein [Burkholderiaceae bacterium]
MPLQAWAQFESSTNDSPAARDAAAPLVGQLNGTLARIHARGSVAIGYRSASIPFSYLSPRGEPIGYSIDICRAIVDRISTQLDKELKIEWVPVTSDSRLGAIESGQVDLECGSTTANAERMKRVAFSPTIFVAGTRLLVGAGSGIRGYRDLGGRTVVVTRGTTNEAAVRDALKKASIDATIVIAPDHEESYQLLASGKADAMATDDVLLYGLLALHDSRDRYRIVGDLLSYDPYGIGYPARDPDMKAIVGDAVQALAASRELEWLYGKWFLRQLPSGQRLNMPMSPQLAEMFRLMGGEIR